jgi:hypothetical protein
MMWKAEGGSYLNFYRRLMGHTQMSNKNLTLPPRIMTFIHNITASQDSYKYEMAGGARQNSACYKFSNLSHLTTDLYYGYICFGGIRYFSYMVE